MKFSFWIRTSAAVFCYGLNCCWLLSLPAVSAEYAATIHPGAAPAPSSVEVELRAPILGTAQDQSGLSGTASVFLDRLSSPFNMAQITELEMNLHDGMDLSLAGGLLRATAEPGAATISLMDPGEATVVTENRFSQTENLFELLGTIDLSTEEGPFDLSTVAPMMADLEDILISRDGPTITLTANVDLEFTTAVEGPGGIQVPTVIHVRGASEAIIDLGTLFDFDQDSLLNVGDINGFQQQLRDGQAMDLNSDGVSDEQDLVFLVREVFQTSVGDANLNGRFDSNDLLSIFQTGLYEAGEVPGVGWGEGDMNGDGRVDSSDLLFAFQNGQYEAAVGAQSVPAPGSGLLALLAMVGSVAIWRR